MNSQSCFSRCPRCAERSYEQLRSYGHCINCNYSVDIDAPAWSRTEKHLAFIQRQVRSIGLPSFDEPAA